MRLGDWTELVVLMLLPTILVTFALRIGPGINAVRRFVAKRTVERDPQPDHPPIERLAADLRRLLARHESIMHSPDLPMRAQRLSAVEGAIGDCACEAAAALGLAVPTSTTRVLSTNRALSTKQLRSLLRALAEEGLALPSQLNLSGG